MKTIKKTAMLLVTIALNIMVINAATVVSYPEEVLIKEEKVQGDKTVNEEGNAYTTGIGFRGGFTSGLTVKHFIGSDKALEGILGVRYRGFSFTGLYELHKFNAFEVPNLNWEYGLGARIGFYNNYYYNNKYWNSNYNYGNETIMTLGVVGVLGLEYKFDEVPFTVSLDIMPFLNFVGWNSNFIDGSISIRYILK